MNRVSRAAFGATLIALTVLLTACGKETTTPGAAGVSSRKVVVSATQSGKAMSARPATDPPKTARISLCASAHIDAVVAPGEAPSEEIWDSGIVVTNRGTVPCTLQGVSKLEFYTGGDGRPLGSRRSPPRATRRTWSPSNRARRRR